MPGFSPSDLLFSRLLPVISYNHFRDQVVAPWYSDDVPGVEWAQSIHGTRALGGPVEAWVRTIIAIGSIRDVYARGKSSD